MPFLRFTRDKRGYEHFQLVQGGVTRRGTAGPRILYWFRSPPNVRVGGKPFDDAARAALERHNPDVEFDWTQMRRTSIAPGAFSLSATRQFAVEEAAIDRADTDAAVRQGADARAAAAAEAPAATDVPPADASASSRRNRRRRRRRRPADSAADAGTPAAVMAAEPAEADDGADDEETDEDGMRR